MKRKPDVSMDGHPLSRTIKFRLGCSAASAVALTYEHHPHVLRLTLIRGVCHRLLLGFLLRLPLAIQALARKLLPACFLPATVVLKKLKPGWDEEFENEQSMYKRLERLQGHVIPVYYGEAWCDGTRALILSDVRGVLSCEQEKPRLDPAEFETRIKVACGKLASFGVAYGDKLLENVLLVEDGVVFVDLEMAWEPEPEDLETFTEMAVNTFDERYRHYLTCMDNEENGKF